MICARMLSYIDALKISSCQE